MKSDDLILSFDTATQNCSVAVTRGGFSNGQVLGSLSFDSGVTHSRRLLSAIDWLLKSMQLAMSDMSAIAVGLGPGSFTGLRIGMATAKGLVHGAGLSLIGVSSLDGIGAAVISDRLICVLIDARKKKVYCCFYRRLTGAIAVRCSEAAVLDPHLLARQITEPVTMAGDGVRVYSDIFTERLGEQVEIIPWIRYPEATTIGFLAAVEHSEGRYLDLDRAKPQYIRSSDAQLSLVSPNKTK